MLRVNRLAAAIDMIAAGTRAPMPIAAKAMPTNQDGKLCRNSAGTAKLLPVLLEAGGVLRQLVDAGGDREKAEQGQQAEQERIGRQQRGVAAHRMAAARALSMPVIEWG